MRTLFGTSPAVMVVFGLAQNWIAVQQSNAEENENGEIYRLGILVQPLVPQALGRCSFTATVFTSAVASRPQKKSKLREKLRFRVASSPESVCKENNLNRDDHFDRSFSLIAMEGKLRNQEENKKSQLHS